MYNLTKYYNTKSIIHDINPLFKIICVLIFTLLVLLSSNIIYLSILFVYLFIVIYISNVPIRLYLKNLKYMLPMIIFIFIINLILSNLNSTIILVLKLILFVLYSQIILYTTKSNDITYGLEELLSPLKKFKINSSVIALTISLALKFIPNIFKESEKVLKSQVSRGLNFSGNLSEKCDKLVSVIIPIFTLSLKRSVDISYVLDMRLYRVGQNKTKYKLRRITSKDEISLILHIILILIFLIFEVNL